MQAFKKVFAACLLIGSIFGTQAAHAGIPVIDAANLVEQLLDVISWIEQGEQMVQQYQTLSSQLRATTGTRNLGQVFNSPLMQGAVPANVGQTLNAITNNGYAGLTQAAQALRDATMVYNCLDKAGASLTKCQAVLNTTAQSITNLNNALGVVSMRVSEIQNMQQQINQTDDPMSVNQVQGALGAETAQVANDTNRLLVMIAQQRATNDQAQQQLVEPILATLSPTAPTTASTFVYQAP